MNVKVLKLTPRMRRAYAELDDLALRESWSRDRIASFQLQRLNEIWAVAQERVPHYRRLAAAHDLPARFESIEHYTSTMPRLRKDVLRADGRALLVGGAPRGSWHPTSGSTGTPLSFFWSHDDHREVLRARYRFYESWGIDILDRSAFVWGGGERGGWAGRWDRAVRDTQDVLRSRLRLSAAQPTAADVERLVAHRPVYLYGFTQAVHLLAQRAIEIGATLPSLRAVIVTGETAAPPVLTTIAEAFRAPAVVEYGSTESMLIAGSDPDPGHESAVDGALRVREDLVLLETVARPHGGYDIVLSVLTNRSFPMFRYVIDDVTSEPLHVPETGFAVLHQLSGRSDDLVLTSAGDAVHPAAFDAIFEERTDQIRRFRIHQLRDGSVDVLVEPTAADGLRDPRVIQRELESVVGDFPVRMEVVGMIAPSESGKRRVVRSDLANA